MCCAVADADTGANADTGADADAEADASTGASVSDNLDVDDLYCRCADTVRHGRSFEAAERVHDVPARLGGLGATELATCEDADRHRL